MATELSNPARLKFQQAIDQYSHWHCDTPLPEKPQLIRLLDGGRSNISALAGTGAATDSHQFVMRLDGVNPQRLGLNRNAEWHIQLAAHGANLAPRPVYFNPELGILVSQFCELDDRAMPRQTEITHIADLLRGIHQLPRVKFRMQVLDRVRRYLAHLPGQKIDSDIETLCEKLQQNASQCLCHNDLLAANRLQHQGGILAIDWEYAATGDPGFDLAAICEGDSLSEAECDQLLADYLQVSPSPQQGQRLADYRRVYRYLTGLWEQLTEL
jgi:thiamine kinase